MKGGERERERERDVQYYADINTHTHTHINKHTSTHTSTHILIHTSIPNLLHTLAQMNPSNNTFQQHTHGPHTHTHTHTHTYKRTHYLSLAHTHTNIHKYTYTTCAALRCCSGSTLCRHICCQPLHQSLQPSACLGEFVAQGLQGINIHKYQVINIQIHKRVSG